MSKLEKLYNPSEPQSGMSNEELVRTFEEIQAEIPELSDIELELADLPSVKEKARVQGNGLGWNSGLAILISVAFVALFGGGIALFSSVDLNQLADNDSTSKIELHKHSLIAINKADQNENFIKSDNNSVANHAEKRAKAKLDKNQEVELPALRLEQAPLETLEIKPLNFAVVAPSLKFSRYLKDYNYKYMRSYKVYDYKNRNTSYRAVEEKLSLDPRYPNWNAYRFYEKEMGMTYREYDELLYKALTYLDKERYREVDLIFFAIMKSFPHDQNAWFYSGISSFRQADYKDALSCFDTILNDYPNVFKQEAHWYYTMCLLELDRVKDAQVHIQEIADSKGFYANQAKGLLKRIK
jgi:tetratricopeptide (TPR) repeat protein